MAADSLELPEALRDQFAALERRLWRVDTAVAVCGAVCALIASYVLVFLSDRLWDTPLWLRAGAALAGLVAVGWFAWFYGSRWVWGSRTLEQMARLVQKRHRRLGDRLLGIVELADEKRRSPNLSPALCRAAIGQVAAEAGKFDFGEAVTTRRSRRYFHVLIGLAIVALAPAIIAPQASWNALQRWLLPGAGVARYTFVSLADVPDRLVVAHGEGFEIAVGVEARSFWKPQSATAAVVGQAAVDAPIRGGRVLFKIPGQTVPVRLALSVGDVSREVAIVPVHRPALQQLSARVTLPDYLQLPPVDAPVVNGGLTVVEGSRVALEGKVSRWLREASIEGAWATVSGDVFSTEPVAPPEGGTLSMTWVDEHGLSGAEPWILKMQTRPDAPPEVKISGLAGSVAMLEDEMLAFEVTGTDEFGVRDVGLRWETEAARRGVQETEEKVTVRTLADGKPDARALPAKFEFSPALLGIAPDTRVTLFAIARDWMPDRVPSRSASYTIRVLSREEHARLIQAQFDKLLARVEELARRQEALLAAGEEIAKLPPEELSDPATGEKLAAQAREQKELGEAMERIAQEMAETLREGLRNPSLSKETLEKMGKLAAAMKALGAEAMPEASKSLGQAGEPQSAEARAGKVGEATQQEREILKKMQEMQKKAAENMDRLAAENMAMRLRKIAQVESGIAARFGKILPEVVGLSRESLSEEPAAAVAEMEAAHAGSTAEARGLEGEITRFGERTRLERYQEVSREMDVKTMQEAMAALRLLIANNTSARAIHDAQAWARQFEEWAARLADKDDKKSPPKPGDGQGQPDEAKMRAMMALMRLRHREASLRDQTMALESRRADYPRYEELARRFAATQESLMAEVREIQKDPMIAQVVPPQAMEPVHAAMSDARTELAKPDTGAPAVSAETDAINIIDYLLESKCKGGGGSGAGQMAMLMQMMGKGSGMGRGPGASSTGGTTDQENVDVAGARTGDAGEERAVEKGSGVSGERMPAEFRDALQGYYNGIE